MTQTHPYFDLIAVAVGVIALLIAACLVITFCLVYEKWRGAVALNRAVAQARTGMALEDEMAAQRARRARRDDPTGYEQ